jgi:dolichol-phosphate mannosyltransferase
MHIDVSIITPVFNEKDNLIELYERIKNSIPHKYSWELIFIDDGSLDGSQAVINEICNKDTHVKAFFLSKNFGHQMALTAGYDHTQGKLVISLDSDLEHPPELIPKMIELWEKGKEIVFARRRPGNKKYDFKRISSRIFYHIMNKYLGVNLIRDCADFRLMDHKVVESLRQYRESSRFLRGIISNIGYERAILNFDEGVRKRGDTKYALKNMIQFSVQAIISFSAVPLRIFTLLGLGISILSILYSLWIITEKLVYGIPSGQASILVGIYFLGGVQLISIGVLGEYISGIFQDVKNRPFYLIKEKINFKK